MLGQVYSTVDYECEPGYESESLRLYCSEGEWKGRQPFCDQVKDASGDVKDDFEYEDDQCKPEEAAQCEQSCLMVQGQATCQCHPGYILASDGKTCQDFDECEADNGGCHQVCINKPGTAMCGCNSGFTLAEDGRSCVDDNECSLNNGHGPCQDICTNTEGSYKCSCESVIGTYLDEDGHTCQSTDGCHVNNGGCSHKCIDSYSQVFCLCPEGYSLASDWKTCKDVDECQKENGECEQMCVNEPGSFSCQCHVGFRKVEAEGGCLDVDECAEIPALCGHGDCRNLPGNYRFQNSPF